MLELKNISFKVKALDNTEEITILDNISLTIDLWKNISNNRAQWWWKIHIGKNNNGN